jgi:hypothetical protein
MISLKPYRRAGVPLLAIQTADPAEVVRLAITEVNGTTKPVLSWNCIHGIEPLNDEAQQIAVNLNSQQDPAIATSNPVEALRAIEKLSEIEDRVTIVMLGLTEILDDRQSGVPTRQALWNLRDVLSKQGSLLILAAPLGWTNPFPDDIAVIVMELPTRNDHIKMACQICEAAGVAVPNKEDCERIGDALLGLSGFAAEQALALSVTKKGIKIETLWERKRQQIAESKGLMVYNGKEVLNDVGGCDQAKSLLTKYMTGKDRPGAIIFIDEIEKALAGSGDTSGVSQAMLGYLLSYMQDNDAHGIIFVGPPGAAKSAMAKAIGNEAGIPTIMFDMGGTKGSLVGESEARMAKNLSIITSVSGGRPFFVATCNSISVLPPELRRRFTVGTMFFDLPNADERKLIWDIYITKYGLGEQDLPDAEQWTGAEIKQCCDMADRLGVTLVEAAKFVVPVAVSAREQIKSLRQEASGRYLSAGEDGVYMYSERKSSKTRKVTV